MSFDKSNFVLCLLETFFFLNYLSLGGWVEIKKKKKEIAFKNKSFQLKTEILKLLKTVNQTGKFAS